MRFLRLRPARALALFTLMLALAVPARACTSLLLQAADGGYVYGRTMEFTLQMRSQLIIVPRGLTITTTGPDGTLGKGGMTYTTKYAAAGANGLGLPIIIDGVNEKGLSGGLFNFPSYAGFQTVPANAANRSLMAVELVTWVFTNCATVDDIKAALPNMYVTSPKLAAFGNQSPAVHYAFHDANGKSIAVEYTNGQLHIYDNPTHVFTNAPEFPVHLAYLAQFQYITPDPLPPIKAGTATFAAPSSGDGLNGLPGGYLATARFVRAFFGQQFAAPSPTTMDAVKMVYHLLGGLELPPGAIHTTAEGGGEGGGVTGNETTEWTAAADMKNMRYYIRTYDNFDLRYVDLKKADLNAKAIRVFPLDQPQMIRDLTNESASHQAHQE